MAIKAISTVLMDMNTDKTAFAAAQAIAAAAGAHLEVICLGLDRTQPGFYYASANAMIVQDNLTRAQEDAAALEAEALKALEGASFAYSVEPLAAQLIGLNGIIAHRTRFSDLVVLPRPYGEGRGHDYEAVVESAMFGGDVPVLIQPDADRLPESIDTVVVGWNEGPEALRAIKAAMPFLVRAQKVSIAVIDPSPHGPERSDPGGALAQLLARHGASVEVSVLARTMPRISDILTRHAKDIDADMIVMGAYGHSRLRESILGGATRNMLETAEVPVLLAH